MSNVSMRAKIRYKFDEFLSSGAGKQLLLLFVLSMVIVLIHVAVASALALPGTGDSFIDKFWFYFTRILDAGTMGGDEGQVVRVISTVDTILGVIVAGLLISALAGNFQERLDAIKRGGSPVIESGHFLILGWSEKIFSVIDQLSEANVKKGRITVVVMADREKVDMEERLRDKLVHLGRVKLVVRSGSSVSITDLSKVALPHAESVVVLIDEADRDSPNKADGRIVKTLMAIFNHPEVRGAKTPPRVTAEVMLAANQEIAEIASGGRAHVIKTNEIISKIILQTSRISGLSLVYDELLRFEGNEIHYTKVPQVVGKKFGEVLLDFPNGCVCGVAKADGSSHILNPSAEHVISANEELLILAEDDDIPYVPHPQRFDVSQIQVPATTAGKKVEHMLVLGWNEKIFPIIAEFDSYVGPKSTLTILSTVPESQRRQQIADAVGETQNLIVQHVTGEFTSRALMEKVQPHRFPMVMVLGDTASGGGSEEADTRAIIALLLLRDFRARDRTPRQEVCSEILDPKNRELAATTEIHDIVISNEMVSMVLAQVTNEPRVRPVLEDLFRSEGSETYLKPIELYAPLGEQTSFERLILMAKARGEVALGFQSTNEDPAQRYGLSLNPSNRRNAIIPKPGDRLVVLAEDDG